jgi:hypothetical protein
MEDKLNRLSAVGGCVRRGWGAVQKRLGTAGIVGVAFLAAAGTGLLYAPQLLNEADSLHVAVDRTRARLAEIDHLLAAQPGSTQQLASFHTWLPPFEQSTGDLRKLFEIAKASRIQLPKGDYALKQNDSRRVVRLDVVLPIRNAYRDVRGFVAATLDALPHASLAELRMERTAANVEPLDARLRITLYYRDH